MLQQRTPVTFNHNYGAFFALFLHSIKIHVYRCMNISKCTTFKICYREIRLSKNKFNSMHNARGEDKNCGRQGTKREGQDGQEDRNKWKTRVQRQCSKDAFDQALMEYRPPPEHVNQQ